MNQFSPNVLMALALFISVILSVVVILNLRRSKSSKPLGITSTPSSPKNEKQKGYTYKDFAKDLSDENVEISDILERCKDAEAPEHVEVGASGQPGNPAPQGLPETTLMGAQGSPIPLTVSAGVVSKQAWFAQLARQLPNLKLVPPPVPQAVVVAKGFTVRCTCSVGSTQAMQVGSPRLGAYHPEDKHHKVKCKNCNDTGIMIVTGGK